MNRNKRAATDALWVALVLNATLSVPLAVADRLTKWALEIAKGAKA